MAGTVQAPISGPRIQPLHKTSGHLEDRNDVHPPSSQRHPPAPLHHPTSPARLVGVNSRRRSQKRPRRRRPPVHRSTRFPLRTPSPSPSPSPGPTQDGHESNHPATTSPRRSRTPYARPPFLTARSASTRSGLKTQRGHVPRPLAPAQRSTQRTRTQRGPTAVGTHFISNAYVPGQRRTSRSWRRPGARGASRAPGNGAVRGVVRRVRRYHVPTCTPQSSLANMYASLTMDSFSTGAFVCGCVTPRRRASPRRTRVHNPVHAPARRADTPVRYCVIQVRVHRVR